MATIISIVVCPVRNNSSDNCRRAYETPNCSRRSCGCRFNSSMIAKGTQVREQVRDYLFNLEAMTRKEAKRLWRQSIKDAWQNRCAYCNNPPIDDKSLTVDHVKPKAKGGEDRTSNCVPACTRCNHSKGSENWLEWFGRQKFYSLASENRIRYWLENGIVTDLEDNENIHATIYELPSSGDIYDCYEFFSVNLDQEAC